MAGLWPQSGPAIITANHESYLDGPVLALLAPRPILFGVDPYFSTREPWRPLLLAWGRITGGHRMVSMTPGSSRGLREMLHWLRDGGWVCLFPEGGIGTGREYPGVYWLADRSGARIHPLEIRTVGVGKARMPYNIDLLFRESEKHHVPL